MLLGLKYCVQMGLSRIIAETDSALLIACVKEEGEITWRIMQAVSQIKQLMKIKEIVPKHCYREANGVADKLSTMSHIHRRNIIFNQFSDLPRQVRGLLKLDKWEVTSFRIHQLKAVEITFEPP